MNILEAIEAMKAGKMVKRPEGVVYFYSTTPVSKSLCYAGAYSLNGKENPSIHSTNSFNLDEVEATNWGIYELPNN